MNKITKEPLWTVKITQTGARIWSGNFVGQPGFYTIMDAVMYDIITLELDDSGDAVEFYMDYLNIIREILEQLNSPLDYSHGWHAVRVAGTKIGSYKTTHSEVFVRESTGDKK